MINAMTSARPDVLYFVHVPKCAGTTVEVHFLENLPAAQVMRPGKSAPAVRYLHGRAWSAPAGFDRGQARVLCGHFFGRATGALLEPHNPLEAILIRRSGGALSVLVQLPNDAPRRLGPADSQVRGLVSQPGTQPGRATPSDAASGVE